MSQNIMITGAGKAVGLGFNMVLRYLEAGDNVVATVRKPCAELEELKIKYGNKLTILTMDIGSTESVQAAAEELSKKLSNLDLLINNAVSVSPSSVFIPVGFVLTESLIILLRYPPMRQLKY